MARSLVTIDLGAIRDNAARLRRAADGAELWAVVKADAYGHGAADVARAALDGGATALCVATVGEGVALRTAVPEARVIVLSPARADDLAAAREARLELCVSDGPIPDGVSVHLKLDTGMGRWGLSELPLSGREVVGVMTHLATADSDPLFARIQLERFRAATTALTDEVTRHAANSAATLSLPEARLDAVRCGIALYGVDPFGRDPGEHGLRPALRWESEVALVKRLPDGESTGYGRRFIAAGPTWVAIVPVGYADGFARSLTGTEVAVAGHRRQVVGTVSMDAVAVALPAPVDPGTPVTLVGDGITLESHTRVANTIAYELLTGIRSATPRAERRVTSCI